MNIKTKNRPIVLIIVFSMLLLVLALSMGCTRPEADGDYNDGENSVVATIVYDSLDGSGGPGAQTILNEGAFTVSSVVPVPNDPSFIFLFWSTVYEDSADNPQGQVLYPEGTYTISQDTTLKLYAVYRKENTEESSQTSGGAFVPSDLTAFTFTLINSGTSYAISDNLTNSLLEAYLLTNSGRLDFPVTYLGLNVNAILTKGFQNQIRLFELEIASGMTSIGESAFAECYNLKTISIASTAITKIEKNAFKNCQSLVNITVPSGVTKIENGVFYGCSALAGVTFSGNVTTIDANAFYGCGSLTSVSIPNTVTSIGNYAFAKCSGLTAIAIPNQVQSIGNYAFADCTNLASINFIATSKVASIGVAAFKNCSSLTTVTIPGSLTTIGAYAFQSAGLTALAIPSTVASIGDYAFKDCVKIASLTISNAVIGNYSFSGCTGLSSVTIPSTVTSISSFGTNAFEFCTGLTSVNLSAARALGNYAFYYCTSLASVTIPTTITTSANFGSYVFSNCTSLKQATINSPVIGNYGFAYCFGLETVTINSTIATAANFGTNTFSNCLNLTTLNSTTITVFGNYAFEYCTSITDLTKMIPAKVTNLTGTYVFQYCTGLTDLVFPSTLLNPGSYTFAYCSNVKSITIPSTFTALGSYAFRYCDYLETVNVNTNTDFSSSHYSFNYAGRYGNGITVNFAANLTRASNYLFYPSSVTYAAKVVKINFLGENVTAIGTGTFYYCTSLTEVTIPSSVTTIGNSAFGNCTSLTTVYIKRASPITTLGGTGVFTGASLLSAIYVPASSVSAYQTATYWSTYAGIISADPTP